MKRSSPSASGSGMVRALGSARDTAASAKATPCFFRFEAALTGSHSNPSMAQCMHKCAPPSIRALQARAACPRQLTPEFSGHTPTPQRTSARCPHQVTVGRVHFIVPGRCNEMLYLRKSATGTRESSYCGIADNAARVAGWNFPVQVALPDHATTAPAAQHGPHWPEQGSTANSQEPPPCPAADQLRRNRIRAYRR